MLYKNISTTDKTFYGVTFTPGDIKDVPSFIHHRSMIKVDKLPDAVTSDADKLSKSKPSKSKPALDKTARDSIVEDATEVKKQPETVLSDTNNTTEVNNGIDSNQ